MAESEDLDFEDAPDDLADEEESLEFWQDALPDLTENEFESVVTEAAKLGSTVAAVMLLDLFSDAWESVEDAEAKDTPQPEFYADVSEKIADVWSPSRDTSTEESEEGDIGSGIDLAMGQATQNGFNLGRDEQQDDEAEASEEKTYSRYCAEPDACDVCAEFADTVLPSDDPWWDDHQPQIHFNSLADDTGITTDEGIVSVGDVKPGDKVMTHKRRWRKVTSVLHKFVRNRRILSLKFSTGRILRVTDEHPILVSSVDGLRWKFCGDLKIGDKVLQHSHKMLRTPNCAIVHADDAPALGNQRPVSRESCADRLSFPVQLNGYFLRDERKVDDKRIHDILGFSSPEKEPEEILLSWGEFLTPCGGYVVRDLGPNRNYARRISRTHHLRYGWTPKPPRPVIGSASFGDNVREPSCNLHLLAIGSDGYFMSPAPRLENRLTNAHASLNGPKTHSLDPVMRIDKLGDSIPVSEIEWHESTVITIEYVIYSGELCDLSVEEDETYVAGDVVVHNCRCAVEDVSEAEAKKIGIDEKGPALDAMPGFGFPSAKWVPDLSTRPPELVHIYHLRHDEHLPPY